MAATFQSEKVKPFSKKITLVELDIPTAEDDWVNFESGLWFSQLRPGGPILDDQAQVVNYGINNDQTVRLTGVRVAGSEYVDAIDLATFRTTASSYYWDDTNQTIYVHFTSSYPPSHFAEQIFLQIVSGFCDVVDPTNDGYYDDVSYDPRIVSVFSISKRKDPIFFGLLAFAGGTITMENADGFFDDFWQLPIYGQQLRIYYGFEGLDYSEFDRIYTGFIQDFSFDFNKIKIKVKDKRKLLSTQVPPNAFLLTTYPDLSEDDRNKRIPYVYGTVRNAPIVCTNKIRSPAPATYNFTFADTTYHDIKSLDVVYVNGVEVTPSAVDLTTGTFTLSSSQYDPLGPDEVTADIIGFEEGGVVIENGLDVLIDVLENDGDIVYNGTNYNTTEWAAETLNGLSVGRFLDSSITLTGLIEEVCIAMNGIFEIQDDGKFTFRIYDPDRVPVEEIGDDEWVGEPQIEIRADQYLSKITVNYSVNVAANYHRRVEYDDEEVDILKTFQVSKGRLIDTILSTEAGATTKAQRVLAIAGTMTPIVSWEVPTAHISLNIMDFVYAAVRRFTSTVVERSKWEVLGINKGSSNGTVKLVLRQIIESEDPLV